MNVIRLSEKKMNKKTIFWLIVIFNTAISQNFSYFPLSVGNKWFFEDDFGIVFTIQIAAADSTLSDGNKYTRIDRYDLYGSTADSNFKFSSRKFLRQEGDSIIQYPNILLFEFSSQINDTIHYNEVIDTTWSTLYAVIDTIKFEDVFDRTLTTYTIFTTKYDYHSYTDSIGFNTLSATTWNNWVPRYLAGCIIDGVQYGKNVTSVNKNSFQPIHHSLRQNYPNPFNSTTTISFSIPRRESVAIYIYDILGKKVKTVLNEVLNSGNHSIKLEIDEQPSGVYIYQLQTSTNLLSKKLLYLK